MIDKIKIPVTADMISPSRAKEIAMSQISSGVVVECEFEYEHGTALYEIEIMKDNTKYEYDIDARTGSILKSKVKSYY